ncbi:MAG: hypothetical protein IJA72_00465 [Clostridia bacterium]|nr:hypothetical protein [Clostridia bacterium]
MYNIETIKEYYNPVFDFRIILYDSKTMKHEIKYNDCLWYTPYDGNYISIALANYIINKLERLTDNKTSWLLQDRLTWNVLNNLK